MSNWLTHFFLFCVKLFLPIMSLWKRPYLLKCNHARQEKINKSITSLRLNKLRLKQGSLTFDNDLVMPHAFFELVSYAQSCYAHTRLCCGRFAPWLIWKQADAAHSPAGSKNRNGWERLEIWGAIALRGHCAPYPMVSARVVLWGWSCCQETKLTCYELPPRLWQRSEELRGCGTCAPLTAALQLRSLQCTVRYSRLQFKDRLRFCTENIKLIQVTRGWKIKWTDN